MSFFNQDSAFSRIGTILFDLLILNLMVAAGSIVTLGVGYGALNTAMYYSIHKTFFEKEGYIFKNFKKSLKVNVFQATVVWLILLFIGLISYMSAMVSMNIGGFIKYLAVAHLLILLQVTFISLYAFPLLALVDIKTKALLTQSFLFANKHLWATISALSVFLLGLFLSLYVHGVFMLLIFSGSGFVIYQLVVKRILIKYFTEEQKYQLFSEFREDNNEKED